MISYDASCQNLVPALTMMQLDRRQFDQRLRFVMQPQGDSRKQECSHCSAYCSTESVLSHCHSTSDSALPTKKHHHYWCGIFPVCRALFQMYTTKMVCVTWFQGLSWEQSKPLHYRKLCLVDEEERRHTICALWVSFVITWKEFQHVCWTQKPNVDTDAPVSIW